MKVALVVPGGVDRSGTHRVIPCLLWLIERLAAEVELHVYALRQEPRPGRWPLLGATVHNIGSRPRRLRAPLALAREHRRHPFDLFHGFWAAPEGIIAGGVARFASRPSVLTLAGGELASLPDIGYGLRATRRGRLRLRLAVRLADRVTVASGYMQARAEALGIAVERVTLGVAPDRWPVRAPRRRSGAGPARILHVATLNRVKDQATLLRAVQRVRDAGHDVTLDIVGQDTLGGAVRATADRLRLCDTVRFHGFLPHDELRPLVESADVLVLSSRYDAAPMVVQEAAVAGVPTVGTAVGFVGEWAPDAAVAVPVGDAEALGDAILALLADEERRLKVARQAQARALAEDADHTAARFLEIYGELSGR